MLRPVGVEAAGEREVLRPLDHVNRVELNEAHLLDELSQYGGCGLAAGVCQQPLRAHQEQACRLYGDDR